MTGLTSMLITVTCGINDIVCIATKPSTIYPSTALHLTYMNFRAARADATLPPRGFKSLAQPSSDLGFGVSLWVQLECPKVGNTGEGLQPSAPMHEKKEIYIYIMPGDATAQSR
jgi:hypothetical protein